MTARNAARIPPRWQWGVRGVIAGWVCKLIAIASSEYREKSGIIWSRSDLSWQKKRERSFAVYTEEWDRVFCSDLIQRKIWAYTGRNARGRVGSETHQFS